MLSEWSCPAVSPSTPLWCVLQLQPNQTASQKSMRSSAVGTLLIVLSVFRKPVASQPAFTDQIPYILQSSFHKPPCSHTLPNPTNWLWYLCPLSPQSTLYVPLRWHLVHSALCFGYLWLDFFPLLGSWRAGTTSFFLKLWKLMLFFPQNHSWGI